MTIISLVRSNKRGKTSRKRSLWLPIIAPKGKTSSSGVNPAVPVKTSIPRSHERFPPRSRKGCWTCRVRRNPHRHSSFYIHTGAWPSML
ncbi:hypothetical protein BDV40DRAFT_263435, partial [Aspergillus tamarii]